MDALKSAMSARSTRWVLVVPLMLAAAVGASEHSVLQWEMGQAGSYGNSDGPALDARFMGTLTPYRDKDGALLVADAEGNALRRIGQDGIVTTIIGKPGTANPMAAGGDAQQLTRPSELARLADGRLLVVEQRVKGLRAVDAKGRITALQLRKGEPMAEAPALGAGGSADIVVAPAPPSPPSLPAESRQTAAPVAPEAPLLPDPSGIAVDAKGRIWVADSGSYRERTLVIDTQGKARLWEPGQMIMLRKIAAAADGKLWGINGKLLFRLHDDRAEVMGSLDVPEWTPPADYLVQPPASGPVAALIGQVPFSGRGSLPPMPSRPRDAAPVDFSGLTIDPQGRPLLIDRHRLLRFEPRSAEFTTLLALPAAADDRGYGDSRIDGVAVDGKGRIVLAIDGGSALFTLGADGRLALVAGHAPPSAWWQGDDIDKRRSAKLPASLDDSIVMLPDGGTLYVARLDNALFQVDRDGNAALWAGNDKKGRSDGPRLEARFSYPTDLARARDGTVYVADSGSARIRAVRSDGVVQTLAGNYSESFRGDGDFARASFYEPKYIALDEARNVLYVLDDTPYVGSGDVRLRRLDLRSGQVTTLASDEHRPMDVIAPSGELQRVNRAAVTVIYKDIAVGPDGYVYALDENAVWRIDPESGLHRMLFHVAERPLEKAYELAYAQAKSSAEREALSAASCSWVWCRPERIEVDAQGNVYLSDVGNNTVLRIGLDGKAGVIAGALDQVGNRAGALPGGLHKPGGLAFSAEGDLMINVNEQGVMRLRNPAQAPFSIAVPGAGGIPEDPVR